MWITALERNTLAYAQNLSHMYQEQGTPSEIRQKPCFYVCKSRPQYLCIHWYTGMRRSIMQKNRESCYQIPPMMRSLLLLVSGRKGVSHAQSLGDETKPCFYIYESRPEYLCIHYCSTQGWGDPWWRSIRIVASRMPPRMCAISWRWDNDYVSVSAREPITIPLYMSCFRVMPYRVFCRTFLKEGVSQPFYEVLAYHTGTVSVFFGD
jgi:hypothetical protein